MPLTQLLGEAILDNLDIQDIEFAESRYAELSADQLEPIIAADTPATLDGLGSLRERCQFAAAWHHARGRLELSAKYKALADNFRAQKSKKLN